MFFILEFICSASITFARIWVFYQQSVIWIIRSWYQNMASQMDGIKTESTSSPAFFLPQGTLSSLIFFFLPLHLGAFSQAIKRHLNQLSIAQRLSMATTITTTVSTLSTENKEQSFNWKFLLTSYRSTILYFLFYLCLKNVAFKRGLMAQTDKWCFNLGNNVTRVKWILLSLTNWTKGNSTRVTLVRGLS